MPNPAAAHARCAEQIARDLRVCAEVAARTRATLACFPDKRSEQLCISGVGLPPRGDLFRLNAFAKRVDREECHVEIPHH